MPRRREVPKREILPDPKYNDVLVAKFINNLMSGGKKSTAENIMYGAFDIIEDKSKEDPLKVFKRALDNAQRPQLRSVDLLLLPPTVPQAVSVELALDVVEHVDEQQIPSVRERYDVRPVVRLDDRIECPVPLQILVVVDADQCTLRIRLSAHRPIRP